MKLPASKIKRTIIVTAIILFVGSIASIQLLKTQHQVTYRETITIREQEFSVKLAQTGKERSEGLMWVEELPENEGLLFIYEQEGYRSFWMKNTLIPLDIVFIDDVNRIVDVIHEVQPCEQEHCPTYRSAKQAKYVLEINGGISKTHEFKIGDLVEFSNLE